MIDYYKDCAIPKPLTNKKKKKVNGFKTKPKRTCYFCGKPYAERHELFGGPLRQISIDNGFQVDVCREHHEAMHKREGKWNQIVEEMRAECQSKYEQKLLNAGVDQKAARIVWMELMGRNWL